MRFKRPGRVAATTACPVGLADPRRTIAFVDHAYLRRDGARVLGLAAGALATDPTALLRYLHGCAASVVTDARLDRVYWYDAAFDPTDRRCLAQQRALRRVAALDLVHLRVGQIRERVPEWQHDVRAALAGLGMDAARLEQSFPLRPVARQKQVDALLTIDVTRLADRGALGSALILAGDGDFAPAVRIARDADARITILTPTRFSTSQALRELADRVIEIPTDELARILVSSRANGGRRPAGTDRRPSRPHGGPGPGGPDAATLVLAERAIATTDGSGVSYVPFVDDARVGYIVRRHGRTTRLYLNPSTHDGDAQATVVVCVGPHGDPARDTPLEFHHPLAPTSASAAASRPAETRDGPADDGESVAVRRHTTRPSI